MKKWKWKISGCWLMAAALLMLVGCAPKKPATPSEVVKAAYRAANEGRYEEVEKFLSSGLRKKVNLLVFFGGSLQEKLDKETKKGTIKKVKIKKEEIEGEKATVHFEIRFEDGTTKKDEKKLVLEEGDWKIDG